MTSLEKHIKENGPILSGDLIKWLTTGETAISKEAARKRISRLTGDIYKLRGYFADGQILFYHKEIYGREEYYVGIIEALKTSGKQYNYILQSLIFHYGYVKSGHLASYSASPIFKLKGHLTFDTVLGKLKTLRIISDDGEYTKLNVDVAADSLSSKRAKGIEFAKNFLLVQFNDWSRKIGLVSYNASKFHSEFGKYQFNFVSPSYVGNLTKMSDAKIVPAFVVADIMIDNVITKSQVEFFINKINVLKNLNGLSNFIPFLIVDSIDQTALDNLKSQGVVLGFTNELFGENYKELLQSLINLITNAGAILKKSPDAYLDLIIKLNKLVDGKTNNLRGDLFELAVGYYQGRVCTNIDIGKNIIHEGLRREIDVWGFKENKIIVCECKGYNHPIDKDEIEKWLGEKIPVIRNWILSQPSLSEKDIVFQFWSTGGFTPEAMELLDSRKKATKKYVIEYFNLDNMIAMSQEIKSKKFTEILREYYIKA